MPIYPTNSTVPLQRDVQCWHQPSQVTMPRTPKGEHRAEYGFVHICNALVHKQEFMHGITKKDLEAFSRSPYAREAIKIWAQHSLVCRDQPSMPVLVKDVIATVFASQ